MVNTSTFPHAKTPSVKMQKYEIMKIISLHLFYFYFFNCTIEFFIVVVFKNSLFPLRCNHPPFQRAFLLGYFLLCTALVQREIPQNQRRRTNESNRWTRLETLIECSFKKEKKSTAPAAAAAAGVFTSHRAAQRSSAATLTGRSPPPAPSPSPPRHQTGKVTPVRHIDRPPQVHHHR